jgi:hypothetical protein
MGLVIEVTLFVVIKKQGRFDCLGKAGPTNESMPDAKPPLMSQIVLV